jgi:AI-2 transport protein TqsA
MTPERTEIRLQTTCLLIIAAIGTSFALYWLKPVLIPFVLAVFIALGLAALVDLLVIRLKVPRVLAGLTAAALGLGALGVFAAVVNASVRQLAKKTPVYEASLQEFMAYLTGRLDLAVTGVNLESLVEPLSSIPVQSVGGALVGVTNSLLGIFSQSVLVLIFVVFLMLGGRRRGQPPPLLRTIQRTIKRYIATKLATSAATGLLVGLALSILRVDLALAFGLLTFLLNFIPSIGSIIAVLLPVPILIMSPELSPAARILGIVLPAIIQFGVGNVLEPKILGEALDLHPITILMSLIFWGMLWGVVGMLLAAPIMAALRLVFGQLPQTKPMAELLAGRPDALFAERAPT